MKKPKMKLVELFSGISMTKTGFDNSGVFDIESVATCEMDANAIIARAAVHDGLTPEMIENYSDYPSREEMGATLKKKRINYDFVKGKEYDWDKVVRSKDTKNQLKKTWLADKISHNLGDIEKVEKLPECGMVTFSFPCTDLSVAGKQAGMEEGLTRSGLVWEVVRILKNMQKDGDKLPNFLLMENVDALINKKNLPMYEKLNKVFEEELGYKVKYQVLNTKELSYPEVPTPQNRRRVYGLYYKSALEDNLADFGFPTPFDAGIRLKDILYDDVDLKYYVYNDKIVEMIDKLLENGTLAKEIELYEQIGAFDEGNS